jgi:two-component system, sensor histidine kinase
MKNWSIKTRALFLALMPAAIIAAVLGTYFTALRISDMDESLRERGFALARQLAPASEYGLQWGNRSVLQKLADTALREADVNAVTITDASGAVLVSSRAGQSGPGGTGGSSGPLEAEPAPLLVTASVDPIDLMPGEAAQPGAAGRPGAKLGTVTVEMSRRITLARKNRALGASVLLGLLCLAATALLALRMSRAVTQPIAKMTDIMHELGRGNLEARVAPSSAGELASLERRVNEMAAQLKEARDHLERRVEEATRELTAQKEEAERASLAKSRFLAAASHDLRQPMHALILFVTALKERIQYPEVSRIVSNIEASVSAMLSLFNALLDISRLDAGVLHAKPTDFELDSLLQRLQIEFAPHAMEKGLRFRVMRSSAIVTSDPVLLERVLMNLISNAIRYTVQGGVVVGCRKRKGKVRIEVWDSGPGIPAERHRDIFQEFYQLRNPERDRSKGLGLGLAIVDRMARLLETRIHLKSSEAKGSVFAIEVPRAVVSHVGQEAAERQTNQANSLAGALVVVIDDEAAILDGMRGLLQEWGCEVLAAESGAEALAQLRRVGRTPDAVISDYRLREEETGAAVIARIQAAMGVPLPGVLITGDTGPDTLREAQVSGYQLLHKPVRPAKLRALLTHVVAHKESV